MKRTLIGLGLLVLAGLILFRDFLNIPDFGMSLWQWIFVIGFGYGAIQNFFKKEFTSSFICALITFVILNSHFEWLKIGLGTIILAGFVATIGLLTLTGGRDRVITVNGKSLHEYKKEREREARSTADADTIFGGATRYVNDSNFIEVGGDSVFASTNIYFDNAVILGDVATFSGDAVFSTVKLFVPRNWEVRLTGDRVFSFATVVPSGTPTDKVLEVSGDTVFSRVQVYYL